MTKPKAPAPPHLSIVVKYLAAYDSRPYQAGAMTRANDLLTRILGNDAGLAILTNDALGICFDLDDMQLHFIEGATAEDDHYQVTFLNIPTFKGVRTPEGLGCALSTILERLRLKGKYLEHLRTKGESLPELLL
jgi:hypothetical protein